MAAIHDRRAFDAILFVAVAQGILARRVIAVALLLEVVTTGGPAATAKPRTQMTEAPCPRGQNGEITVCGKPDSPYRIPKELRDPGFQIDGPMDSVSRERHRIMDVGGAGAQQHACSPVGAMGWTGCEVKAWKEADQQRGFQPPK